MPIATKRSGLSRTTPWFSTAATPLLTKANTTAPPGLRPGDQAQSELRRCLQQPRHRLRQQRPIRPRHPGLRPGDQAQSEHAIAFNNRGTAYNDKGQYDRAIQDFDQAIRLDPNYALAFNNRGIAYDDKGQYDRAIQDYDQAIKLDPNYASLQQPRHAYDDKGQYDRAIQDYDQAIKLDPNYARPSTIAAPPTTTKANTTAPSRTTTRRSGSIRTTHWRSITAPLAWERKNDLQRALADYQRFAELAPSDPNGPKCVERVTKALSGR